jgi:phage baseplate assembly protein W
MAIEIPLVKRKTTKDRAIGILLPFNGTAGGNTLSVNNQRIDKIPSQNSGGVFAQSYTTEEQSISNLKNLVLTRRGERLYHPDFGTRVYDYLFEQITESTFNDLRTSLQEDIEFWLPYIVISEIRVTDFNDRYDVMNGITISIRFRVTQQGSERTIVVKFGDSATIQQVI